MARSTSSTWISKCTTLDMVPPGVRLDRQPDTGVRQPWRGRPVARRRSRCPHRCFRRCCEARIATVSAAVCRGQAVAPIVVRRLPGLEALVDRGGGGLEGLALVDREVDGHRAVPAADVDVDREAEHRLEPGPVVLGDRDLQRQDHPVAAAHLRHDVDRGVRGDRARAAGPVREPRLHGGADVGGQQLHEGERGRAVAGLEEPLQRVARGDDLGRQVLEPAAPAGGVEEVLPRLRGDAGCAERGPDRDEVRPVLAEDVAGDGRVRARRPGCRRRSRGGSAACRRRSPRP